ncbi:MAG: hypothetical protein AAF607_10140 [Pseudomonadota bacterium]
MTVRLNPPTSPISEPNGNITSEWYRYFVSVTSMLEGDSLGSDAINLAKAAEQINHQREDISLEFLSAQEHGPVFQTFTESRKTTAITAILANVQEDDFFPGGLLDADIVRLDPAELARAITGLKRGFAAQKIALVNVGSQPITIEHESVSSDPDNRFLLNAATDTDLLQNGFLQVFYDEASTRWRQIGGVT